MSKSSAGRRIVVALVLALELAILWDSLIYCCIIRTDIDSQGRAWLYLQVALSSDCLRRLAVWFVCQALIWLLQRGYRRKASEEGG